MTTYTRFDKAVSDKLCDGWDEADEAEDWPLADAFKRALTELGLPYVRIADEKVVA